MYNIKEVASRLQIRENAIRFYEKKGLITPERSKNNYRKYGIEDISKLQMILLYRRMGFSIEVIEKMMNGKDQEGLLGIFVDQSKLLNKQIHTMNVIKQSIDECVDHMLEDDTLDEELINLLEKSAETIGTINGWEDEWNFNSWAENYDRVIRDNEGHLDFYRNYDQVMQKTADVVSRFDGKVLEIGIGTGNLTCEMMNKGIGVDQIMAIDQSIEMLKQAKLKCPDVRMKIGTFLEIPYEAGMFNTVVSSYAFHHNNDEEKVLAIQEMDRVLGEHGNIIIADLMFASASARKEYESKCSEQVRFELEDEYFANVDELCEMFKESGYVCEIKWIDELICVFRASK